MDMRVLSGLVRRNWRNILLWFPLPTVIILFLALIAGAEGSGPVGALFFFFFIAEALLVTLQVLALGGWWSDRASAHLAALTDDVEALKDPERVHEIRRRARRRLIRRAFGILPAAALLVSSVAILLLVNLEELEGAPSSVLMITSIATALVFPLGLIWLCWRRLSDLVGDPIVLQGRAVPAAGSTQAAPPEGPDPEMIGVEMTSEMNSPNLLVDVIAGWRLTRDKGATPATQPLGQRKIDLVSGAVLAVPRSGTVLLMCSPRGRCIGRLGQFERTAPVHRTPDT
jgi:hypothetical protein